MNRVLRQTPRVSPSTAPTCVSVLVGTWRETVDASGKVKQGVNNSTEFGKASFLRYKPYISIASHSNEVEKHLI